MSRNDTKYGHLVKDADFEVDDEPDAQEQRPRVKVQTHSIVLDEHVDERYVSKYRYRFAIDHDADDGARTVVGWTRSDIEHNGTEDLCSELTWSELPADVKMRLSDALGVRRSELKGMLDLPEHLLEGDS